MTATFSDKTLRFFRFYICFYGFPVLLVVKVATSGEDSNDLAFRCCTGLYSAVRDYVMNCFNAALFIWGNPTGMCVR